MNLFRSKSICGQHPHTRANMPCVNVLLHAIKETFSLLWSHCELWKVCKSPCGPKAIFGQILPRISGPIPRKDSATYLGTLLEDTLDNRAEVSNRIGGCIATCNRSKLLWNKANNSIARKIPMFNAIVRSRLRYGLERVSLL